MARTALLWIRCVTLPFDSAFGGLHACPGEPANVRRARLRATAGNGARDGARLKSVALFFARVAAQVPAGALEREEHVVAQQVREPHFARAARFGARHAGRFGAPAPA